MNPNEQEDLALWAALQALDRTSPTMDDLRKVHHEPWPVPRAGNPDPTEWTRWRARAEASWVKVYAAAFREELLK